MTYEFSTDQQIALALDISRQPIAPRRESLDNFVQWLKDPPYTKLYMIFVELAKKAASVTTEAQWMSLSKLSPWQGITNGPESFSALSKPNRKRFMANAFVIAAANGIVGRSEDAFELARQRLTMTEENLGWCMPGIGDCDPKSPDGITPAGPMITHHPDIRLAFKRLVNLKPHAGAPSPAAPQVALPQTKKSGSGGGTAIVVVAVAAGAAMVWKGFQNE